MKKPKICFVSLKIYPVLKQDADIDLIGGAEVQQSMLGNELAKRGYSVSYITARWEKEMPEYINSSKIISTFGPNEGIPGLRFFYPRLYKIWTALCKSDADIYYVRSASFILAVVVFYAHLKKKKVIYCAADDRDFDPRLIKLPTLRDKILYIWGLKNVDTIIVQNNIQQQSLEKNFKRKGKIIYNAFPKANQNSQKQANILWVSNLRNRKRPHLFLALAEMFPKEHFVMVGGEVVKQRKLFKSIKRKAENIPNLDFKGFLPLKKVEDEFSKAKFFINTSLHEGFPNTFLQSWRRGVPVVSFVDPDNLIYRYNLGSPVKDFDEMVGKVKEYLDGKQRLSPQKIKRYFEENFLVEKMVTQYEKQFEVL